MCYNTLQTFAVSTTNKTFAHRHMKNTHQAMFARDLYPYRRQVTLDCHAACRTALRLAVLDSNSAAVSPNEVSHASTLRLLYHFEELHRRTSPNAAACTRAVAPIAQLSLLRLGLSVHVCMRV